MVQILTSNLQIFRVQKKSRLHGCEPEEDFAFYVIFEEGFVILSTIQFQPSFQLM